MSNYPKALIPAVALAAEYCNTLENARPDQTAETAAALLRLLPRIYITLSDIGGDEADQDGDDNGAVTATLKQEEYDAILSATTALLGEFDMYLDTPEYDMQFSDTAVAVSLAEQLAEIVARFEQIAAELRAKGISVKIDDRDNVRPGFKFAEYELKGVPVRLAMGGRDMENGTVELVRRDTLEKETLSQEGLAGHIETLMTDIQHNIFRKALDYRNSMITRVDTWDEFKRVLDEKGGFISAHWDGTVETEVAIKEATKATIRCIPVDAEEEEGVCVFSGKPSHRRVLFARSY